tara:strand:- start:8867 stop:9175 length:309 start_codon:yes stop_codon:yes gene_type:complete
MNEEVKATEEQDIPVIKYTNSKGDEVEILESDLNEEETRLVADYNNVKQAIQDIDNAHLGSVVRQSLIMNQNFLNDRLQVELLKREDDEPVIVTETKTVKDD